MNEKTVAYLKMIIDIHAAIRRGDESEADRLCDEASDMFDYAEIDVTASNEFSGVLYDLYPVKGTAGEALCRMRFTCPVCAYDKLNREPKDDLICPQCGFHFGLDENYYDYESWRHDWEMAGKPWFSDNAKDNK